MDEDVKSLATRVRQLERQNRTMRIGTLLVLASIVSLTVVSCNSNNPASSPSKKVTAEEFVLVDANGQQRGRWAIESDGGASLRFYAPDQSILCTLEVNADSGGALTFGSKNGQHFLLMGAKDDLQMIAGDQQSGPLRLMASKFQGGHIGDKTMHHLELRDAEGKTVFNSADYYGFNPQEPKP